MKKSKEKKPLSTIDYALQDYKTFVNDKFSNKVKKTKSVNSILLGLSEECGEVLGFFKKKLYHKRQDMTREKLVGELGDMFYYFTALLINQGISFQEIIDYNQEKLNKRYPNGFTYEDAEKRRDENK